MSENLEAPNSYQEYFKNMTTEPFIEQGVSIFRSAAEGLPTVNPAADAALRELLQSLLYGEAPMPVFGDLAPETKNAWQAYVKELVQRIVEINPVNEAEK